jgi:hypothetical protein
MDDQVDAGDAPPDDADHGDQGRGGEPAAEPRTARPKRKRTPAGGKITPRKYSIPDDLHLRVELHALKKGTSASAIVAEILDRNLPRHRIESD